jgi:Guanosine polyphosphate pyrophosphohydrolases/synthetases
MGTAALLAQRFPGATTSERHAAWLHDVLEDTEVTAEDLRRLGYAPEVIAIVEAVTKPPPPRPSYADWIAGIAREAPLGALRVKLADLAQNSDPARLALLEPARAERLRTRYARATRTLQDALRDRLGAQLPPEPDDRVPLTLRLDPMDYWTLEQAARIAGRSPAAFVTEEALDLAARILATGTLRQVTLARDRLADEAPVLEAFRTAPRRAGPLSRFRPPDEDP